MSKHTPGPWVAVAHPDSQTTPISICEKSKFTGDQRLDFARGHTTIYLNEADAHLIAAAPDMLQALARLEKYAPEVFCLYGLREAARKAEGK